MGRGSDIKRFEEFIYDRLLYEVVEIHPDSAVVLCQPYLFKRDLTGIGNEEKKGLYIVLPMADVSFVILCKYSIKNY